MAIYQKKTKNNLLTILKFITSVDHKNLSEPSIVDTQSCAAAIKDKSLASPQSSYLTASIVIKQL